MSAKQPKKLLIVNILDILKRYSDEEHRLSQKDIVDILKCEYGMTADRKAIRRNILDLMECGYNIEYSEAVRMVKNPKTGEQEETYIWSDFYLVRQFTDGELRLLIDGLLFSPHVRGGHCRELVKKLEGLSNVYFRSRVKHIDRLPPHHGDNQQLFLNIELLDEAIKAHKKVSFRYVEYGVDKRVHERRRPDGSVREYIINPYQMAAKDGKYYLICNYDKYDDISNYRLDRIRDIVILDEPAKPFSSLKNAKGESLDLADYMREHIYMFAGGGVRVTFRIDKSILSDVIDLFGREVQFFDEDDTSVCMSAVVNEDAAARFAVNYAEAATALAPESLVTVVRGTLRGALSRYDAAANEQGR